MTGAGRIGFALPEEDRASPFLHIDSQMLAIPLAKRGRIFRFEEDTAKTGDALHGGTLRLFRRRLRLFCLG